MLNRKKIDGQFQKEGRKTQLLAFIIGQSSRKSYAFYLLVLLDMIIVIFAFSISIYPSPYSFLTDYISNLGIFYENPSGYLVFNLGLKIFGFLSIPLVFFIFREGRDESEISLIFTLISTIGIGFVGIFPGYIRIPHLISASLVFGGFFIANNVYFHNYSIHHKQIISHQSSMKVRIAGFNFAAFTFLLTILFKENVIIHANPLPGILNTPFWEWIYFLYCYAIFLFRFFQSYKTEPALQVKVNESTTNPNRTEHLMKSLRQRISQIHIS